MRDAGLPPTLNPYSRWDAPRAWVLWRQGWHLGEAERADADVEPLTVCDDCATCIGEDRDPEERPGLRALLAARWPGCDLMLIVEELDAAPDDATEDIPLPIAEQPCQGCGATTPGPRRLVVAHRRPSTPSSAGPPRTPVGLVPLTDILTTLPVLRRGDAAAPTAAGPHPEAAALRRFEERLLAATAGDRSCGQLIMLTGRSGSGRTSLALQLAAATARRAGTVAWFSHQAAAPKVALHLLASQSGLAIQDLQGEAAVPGARDAVRALAGLPLRIDDEPELAVVTVQQRCLALAGVASLALVVIDCVELMQRRRPAPSFQAALIPVMHELRTMAQTLGVRVLILGTLSRQHPVDQRDRPQTDPAQLDPQGICDRVLLLYRVEQAARLLPVWPAAPAIGLRFDPVRLRFDERGAAEP